MKVIYPGSFDPITNGHLDIFNKIANIYSLGTNISILVMNSDTKKPLFTIEKRVELVKKSLWKLMPQSSVENYVEAFEGNINDYINQQSGQVIIVRGLRNNTDFDYEMMYEAFTRRFGAQTIYITPEPENIFVSLSLVRNLINTGGSYEELVPWL